MAGLTDQFPISPSRPAVIRSSCTWREAWIPLGFISSNYPLLPPHAVLSLPILYFTSGYWHCPLLPLSNSLFTHFCLLFSTRRHCKFYPTSKSSGWLLLGLYSLSPLCLSLRSLPTYSHINTLGGGTYGWKGPLSCSLVTLREASDNHPSFFFLFFFFPHLFLFAGRPRDEMDSRGLFQIVFLTQAGRSMRTTEKAKSSREQLFTPSLCSFVPPLPSAAFGSESALVLLAVTVCQGANRFLLTGASGGQVWVFHYFLYQVGIIWVRTGLSVSLCGGAGLRMNRECAY